MSSYLESLSQSQRDSLLESITFVDKPKTFPVICEAIPIQAYIVNYSQFFENLTESARETFPFPIPSNLRNGDLIRFGSYRGVGSYYVLWLAKDLISHSSEFVSNYLLKLEQYKVSPAFLPQSGPAKEYSLSNYPLSQSQWTELAILFENEEWWDGFEENFKNITDSETLFNDVNNDDTMELIELIKATYGKKVELPLVPRLISREADGPHNDNFHHAYLFVHPDEMGYFAPSSFSCVNFDYFDREYYSIILDPLLTHSASYYGKILANGTHTLNQLGSCDRFYHAYEDYDYEEIEWVDINDGNSLIGSVFIQGNYFLQTRELFSKHFELKNQL